MTEPILGPPSPAEQIAAALADDRFNPEWVAEIAAAGWTPLARIADRDMGPGSVSMTKDSPFHPTGPSLGEMVEQENREEHGTLRGDWRGEYSDEALTELAASYAAQGVIVADPAHLTEDEMIALNLMPQGE